jgi:hypothetical protein
MDLLRGVSTAWWELFKAVPALNVVYVPIGLTVGLALSGGNVDSASFASALLNQ